jgi:hypothetical protein
MVAGSVFYPVLQTIRTRPPLIKHAVLGAMEVSAALLLAIVLDATFLLAEAVHNFC